MPEVLRPAQRLRALQQLRAAHRHQRLAEQALDPEPGVDPAPHPDADVDVVAREVDQLRGGADAQVEVRMGGSRSRPRRGTSHLAANDGSTLTVSVALAPTATRRSVASAIWSKASRIGGR